MDRKIDRSISGCALLSVSHSNQTLQKVSYSETSATALCGTTGSLPESKFIKQLRPPSPSPFGDWAPMAGLLQIDGSIPGKVHGLEELFDLAAWEIGVSIAMGLPQ